MVCFVSLFVLGFFFSIKKKKFCCCCCCCCFLFRYVVIFLDAVALGVLFCLFEFYFFVVFFFNPQDISGEPLQSSIRKIPRPTTSRQNG